jgi:hypothetical protein
MLSIPLVWLLYSVKGTGEFLAKIEIDQDGIIATSTGISVTWNYYSGDQAEVEYFLITITPYLDPVRGTSFVVLGNRSSCEIGSLMPDTDYLILVEAVDFFGYSVTSNPVVIKTISECPPDPPTGITARFAWVDAFTVVWTLPKHSHCNRGINLVRVIDSETGEILSEQSDPVFFGFCDVIDQSLETRSVSVVIQNSFNLFSEKSESINVRLLASNPGYCT